MVGVRLCVEGLNGAYIIEKLEPRNYKVDAYYLPDADGTINEVYIYQNGRYIATCKPVARYNENTAEQTEYDKAACTSVISFASSLARMPTRLILPSFIILSN